MAEQPPDIQAAQSRATQFADKLFEALEDLRDAGGMAALNPRSARNLAASLRSSRQAIDEALAGLKATR